MEGDPGDIRLFSFEVLQEIPGISLDLLIIGKGLRLRGVILHNDEFQIPVFRTLDHGTDAEVQIPDMVLVWDDNGDLLPGLRENGTIKAVGDSVRHLLRPDPKPLLMGQYRPLSCLKGIKL